MNAVARNFLFSMFSFLLGMNKDLNTFFLTKLDSRFINLLMKPSEPVVQWIE